LLMASLLVGVGGSGPLRGAQKAEARDRSVYEREDRGVEVLAQGPLLGELSHLDARQMDLQVLQMGGTRTVGWKLVEQKRMTSTGLLMDVLEEFIMGETRCDLKEEDRKLLGPDQKEPLACDSNNTTELVTWPQLRQMAAAIWRWGRRSNGTRVAMAGLGAGQVPNYLVRNCPNLARIDIAEIEPRIVEYAKRFFQVKESERLRIHVQNAWTFLEEAPLGHYDVFVMDASGSQLDFVMPRAIRLISSKLRPNGIIIINANEWQAVLPDWARKFILDLVAPFWHEIYSAVDVIVLLQTPAIGSLEKTAPPHVHEWYEMRPWMQHRGVGWAHLQLLASFACCWCCCQCLLSFVANARMRRKVRHSD